MTDHRIKNFSALATTPLRRDALDILEAGYNAIETGRVIREQITLEGDDICIRDRSICLTDYKRIFFVGIGKCAVDAAQAFEALLGDRITDGIVLDVKSGVFQKLRSYVGTHPFPSEGNVTVTEEIAAMLKGANHHDLIFTVVSGGGSSLLCLPHDLKCETLREITEALWKGGAAIEEVNTVRKHLSDIQGGQFAKLAYPATVVSFIFSDVPGNTIDMIASGPTVMDSTTVDDARRILEHYDILGVCRVPNCELVETPKDAEYFARVMNILLVTNETALAAMADRARALGYTAKVVNVRLEGIAREVGRTLATAVIPERTCYLYGGETTVEIRGTGIGGRNQELALAAAQVIPDHRVLVAAASDGWDNTPAAGAITDAGDRKRACEEMFDLSQFLENNDAYRFWARASGAIDTGRTGSNVADLTIVITE